MVPSRANGTIGTTFGQFRAVQQNAERALYPAEHLHHLVEYVLVFGREIVLARDRRDPWHDRVLYVIAA